MADVLQRQRELRERQLKAQAAQQKSQQVSKRAQSQAEIEKFKAENIQLDTGEWISKAEFEKLSTEDQARLKKLGIKGFNDYYQKTEADFKANNVQLKDGWISKSAYEALSPEDQQRIKESGIEGFNKYYEQQQAEFERNNVKLNTGEYVSKTAYNDLSSTWQSALKAYGVDGFQNWLSTAYPGAKGFIVIDDPYAGKMVYGKTDDPNIGIDAGGNRIWIGGRWPDAVKTYLQGVEIRGSKIISREQLQAEKLAEAQKVESIVQTGAEAKVEAQPEIVELDTGELIDKKTFDTLEERYRQTLMKEGIAGLEKQMKAEEAKADAEHKQLIESTKADLAKTIEKQEAFEARPLWDKVSQTLATPVTFDQMVQETLTFGGAKTSAFDLPEIEREYHEARLKALEEGSDLAISKDDYTKQVLAKTDDSSGIGHAVCTV